MGKYRCIRKCYFNGKIFRVGDVGSFQGVPPHHFEPMDALAIETVVSEVKHVDSMKPNNQEIVSALSQFVKQPKAAGFASSLNEENPVKQELKKAGRPRKK